MSCADLSSNCSDDDTDSKTRSGIGGGGSGRCGGNECTRGADSLLSTVVPSAPGCVGITVGAEAESDSLNRGIFDCSFSAS